MPRIGPFALASLSALLLILAEPPFHILLLPFTALVPLGVALGSLEDAKGSGRTAAWLGLAFGGVYWGALLAWVPMVVAPLFPWAYPGYAVQVGLLAGLMGLMAWGTHHLHRRTALPLALCLPLAWVAMEYLKGHFPFGLAFPWLGLGISLTEWPEFLGLAEWTGEGGVAFWLALVNGLLASAILGFNHGSGRHGKLAPARILVLAVGAAVLPAALGVVRARTLPLSDGLRVAVVGTDVPPALRLNKVEGSREALDQVRTVLAGLEPREVDLVVLPEATVSLPLEGEGEGEEFLEALGVLARRMEAPLLLGALGEAAATNSAFLMGSDGSLLARYDKTRLVPGMESGGYERGGPGQTLRVGVGGGGGVTLAPLICYESIFGGVARAQRRAGATLIVNLTSDLWFGDGGVGRIFLPQHPAHLVMRAVETRMGVARAANGGVSFLLDPGGRLLAPPVPPGIGMAVASIPVMEGGSLYSATGDLFGPLSLLLTCLLLGWPSFGRRSKSTALA